MLTHSQIREKLAELDMQRISLEDFEDWFRDNTVDFHKWPDQRAQDMIVSLETVFSEYHFADLEDDKTVRGLHEALLAFDLQPQIS